MSDLDDLKIFVEVVETGGFSRAAKQLGISKSVVSRCIARVEADLGAPLLIRTTRGVSATDAGLEFKLRCERILDDYEEAREAASQQGSAIIGRLRLSAPLSFGVRHISPLLAELAERHPRLELDVTYSDQIEDLIAERYDLVIRIGALKDSSLIARKVASVGRAAIASPAYLNRHGRPKTPDELTVHESLLYAGSMVGEWQFRSGQQLISIRPRGRLRSDSGEALLLWAEAGLGIAYLPTFMLSDAIERGAVEHILQDFPSPEFGIYVVRPPGQQVSGKVRMLIDAVVERFAGVPFWDRCMMHALREDDPQ
ncbi:MAG: LysR family transcriptional regulator [Hyphomicrobiales bacterium]|nr:LysR family transcriptional regulator [Hyphomicrobiales bacterium]